MVVALGLAISSAGQARACSLALALGLDVSGSVDDAEYSLQQQGLAEALIAPSVQQALLAPIGGPVRVLIFEWSDSSYQNVIVPWTLITSRETVFEVAEQIRQHPRSIAPYPTSIGNAMNFAARAFEDVPDCRRKTLDISGDGPSNSWPPPERVRRTPPFQNITVNALVIGSSAPIGNGNTRSQLSELLTYFEEQVIHGPRAFAEAADGFQNYRDAMIRKLLRELEGPQLATLP